MAAACLLVAILLGRWYPGTGVEESIEIIAIPQAPRAEDLLPSWRSYEAALRQSPEALETLLDEQAAHLPSSGSYRETANLFALNQIDPLR
jgi:hypothetical protein